MSIRRPSRGGDVHQSALTDLPESAAPVLRDLIEERFARWDAGQAGGRTPAPGSAPGRGAAAVTPPGPAA